MRGGGSQIKAPTLKLWRQLYPKRTPNPDLRVFLSPKPRPIRRRKGKFPTMKIENGMPLMLEEMIPHEERGWRPASLGECAAEIERLRAALTRPFRLEAGMESDDSELTPMDEIRELQAVIERLETALTRIVQWANAYPLDVFPEPDWKRAAGVLKAHGMTLDSISAGVMRQGLAGIRAVAGEALDGVSPPEAAARASGCAAGSPARAAGAAAGSTAPD